MKTVNVLGYNSNFEGRPAIAAARILARLDPGKFAVDESVWKLGAVLRGCGDPEEIPGKHEGEKFRIRPHDRITFPINRAGSRRAPGCNAWDHAEIEALIGGQEWTVGAINFDEDLHFSSFYLRQSCRAFLPAE